MIIERLSVEVYNSFNQCMTQLLQKCEMRKPQRWALLADIKLKGKKPQGKRALPCIFLLGKVAMMSHLVAVESLLIDIPLCGSVSTQCVDCQTCEKPVFKVKPSIACERGFVWEDYVSGKAQCFDCNWNATDSFFSNDGRPYCDQDLSIEGVLLLEKVPVFFPGSTIGPGYLPTNSPGFGFGFTAMFSLSDYITIPTEPTELIGYSILLFLVVIIIIIISMWCSMVCCNRRRGCCVIQAGRGRQEIELVRG